MRKARRAELDPGKRRTRTLRREYLHDSTTNARCPARASSASSVPLAGGRWCRNGDSNRIQAGPEGEAKFWLEPKIELARRFGLSRRAANMLSSIVRNHECEIIQAWKDHFGS